MKTKNNNKIILKIFRGHDIFKDNYSTFEVPFKQGESILDALIWIKENLDETLSFRYSCINANACKECMISINGYTKYACTSKIREDFIVLKPLPNKVLISDLISDIVPPKEKI